ncbi:uncharacterized protein METZ01_LOCUS266868 [marine metagenome]|uniref:Uncharacterized protein n=1 Tax=marine metagenome TaxID=408172 RepID=A0A382JNH7_9ZZZZ
MRGFLIVVSLLGDKTRKVIVLQPKQGNSDIMELAPGFS